ncbi:MAG: XrtA system polysaccharide deacetylase [Pseudomonadota bacterium]
MKKSYAISVDVEDYFQVWAFSDVIDRKSWDGFSLRVEKNTRRILDLFDCHRVKGTFFTLGWIAEKAPGLVREIADAGHEIASHGYDHAKVFDQTPVEFRADAARTKKILEDCAGVAVNGYRAAGFSIDQRTSWAHEILSEIGYAYSSSEHPIAHDHYGDPNGPRAPYRPVQGSAFIEAPVATAEIMGRRLSAAGGGWFRAAPYAFSKHLIQRAQATQDGPTIFYFHPWEIDPDQPRIASASGKAKFRHYLNLRKMEKKLGALLDDFSWGRIDEALDLTERRAAA